DPLAFVPLPRALAPGSDDGRSGRRYRRGLALIRDSARRKRLQPNFRAACAQLADARAGDVSAWMLEIIRVAGELARRVGAFNGEQARRLHEKTADVV